MAALSSGFNVLLFFAIIIFTKLVDAVKETVIPEISNGRIEATHGGKVINFFWTGCNSPDCETTLVATFEGGQYTGSTVGHALQRYHPYLTPDNKSHVECFYDASLDPDDGSKSTPCKYQGSKMKRKIRYIKTFKIISVTISICINQTCSGIKEYKFVNPARNPCYFNNPCMNNAKCNPGVHKYDCTCTPKWAGKNCTMQMPPGFNYTAGKCLDYDAKIKVIFVSSAKECGSLCAAMNDTSKTLCKSFELKSLPTNDQKNCTLRDSNSLTHRLVTCDSDYFEATAFSSRPMPSTATNSAQIPYLLLLISVAWLL
ncbi:uncharacterized protein LOC116301277 isoform X2 [Actinia tenebrosa]|uniref:Uncharacterized protein LOC116301277 isoform X2 n=1 Tax=Actinia tenebrosa TaxID=6105 RepID=A0A6P8IH41_ACTTE|nr:uncharacterized protein LOC116301277 isoform X2 [Actinia tenebrosa]